MTEKRRLAYEKMNAEKINRHIGEKYGRLTIMSYVGRNKNGHSIYWCKCDCGNMKQIDLTCLRNGSTKSCGCLVPEVCYKSNLTHGGSHSRLYTIWKGMRRRCNNPNYKHYYNYGGRGIVVCNEWNNSYESFRDWALSHGYGENLTIDRIDNYQGYEPNNCRWVTMAENDDNKRNTLFIEYKGERGTLNFWANKTNINKQTLYNRIFVSKWPLNEALEYPTMNSKWDRIKANNV